MSGSDKVFKTLSHFEWKTYLSHPVLHLFICCAIFEFSLSSCNWGAGQVHFNLKDSTESHVNWLQHMILKVGALRRLDLTVSRG